MTKRDERREYEADVVYDVWRSGGNPDRVDPDRMSDAFYDRIPTDDFVRSELRRQRPVEREQEQFPDEQEEPQ